MEGRAGSSPRRCWRRSIAPLVAAAAAVLLATTSGAADATASARPKAEEARSSGKRIDVLLRLDRRRSGLQRLARSVSDPGSPRYGRHVDPTRTARRFGARKATRRRVRSFLRRRGTRARVDATRSFAEALVPARKARRLFGPSRRTKGRIPRGLRGEVRAVLQDPASSDQFLPRRHEGDGANASAGASGSSETRLDPPYARTGTPAGCEQGRDATFQPQGAPVAGPAFTPNQIQTAYGASRLHAQGVTGKGVRAAILGVAGFARDELRGFAECFGIEVPPTRLAKVGTRRAGKTPIEMALDLQMLTLMAPGLERLVVYSVGSLFWPVVFSAMLERRNAPGRRLPHVASVSAGDCESDIGRAEVKLTEHVLAAAAAAGITVAAGSGDAGSFCTSESRPEGFYPSSSRWATSVGGTSLTLTGSNEIADEIVWNDTPVGVPAAGGGGFSRLLRVPFYQRGRERSGRRRDYPDVAAFADGYPSIAVYCFVNAQGNCEPTGTGNPLGALGNGTSAATPLLAGTIALADQRRLEAQGPPLGFANPLLYELGERGGAGALRDVVEGSNNLGRGCCDAGPGYDLASGWGSVDAEGLASAAALRAR